MPRLYALMLNWPMSSPQMTRMFGLAGVCAWAATAARPMARPAHQDSIDLALCGIIGRRLLSSANRGFDGGRPRKLGRGVFHAQYEVSNAFIATRRCAPRIVGRRHLRHEECRGWR